MDQPIPCQWQWPGGRQPELERGKLIPREGILYQNENRLPVSNQYFLKFCMVDIRWEGRSQRSAPQKRHRAHLRRCAPCIPRKPSGWDGEGNKSQPSTGEDSVRQAPGHLSRLDLGQAQNTGPTKCAPLWNTREPEPEWLRPGECMQHRARIRQFPAEHPRALAV